MSTQVPEKLDLYVDYNATSPMAEGVEEAMRPYHSEIYGNASTTYHWRGQQAGEAVATARQQLATLLGATADEVVFTSGGTESCFQAFLGVLRGGPPSICIVSEVEHPAVLEAAALLQELAGVACHRLAVDAEGQIDQQKVLRLVKEHPGALVSLMYANNETGILFPIAELASQLKAQGAIVHCDATQAVGKVALDFSTLGVDLLSLSAHKFAGPKGCGALLVGEQVQKSAQWKPVMTGGGQEKGRRGGTEAVAQIVAMGHAAMLKSKLLASGGSEQLAKVRAAFEAKLSSLLSDVEFHGCKGPRLPNTSNVYIPGVSAIGLRSTLAEQGIVLSTGSACATSHASASHVLRALGRSPMECLSVFRISFGPEHTEQDAELLAIRLAAHCKSDRESRAQSLEAVRKDS